MTLKQLEKWARETRVSLTINYKVRARVFWVQARVYKKPVATASHSDLTVAIETLKQILIREPGRLKS